jgi:tetratricopeptide (TPR) repeat protein
MGRSAWLVDHLDDAALWLDRSLDLSPNYAFALYNRALIDNLLNNGCESEQRSTKAMTLSPIDPLRYAFFGCRALSHVVRGDYSSAITWSDRAIKEPNAHVHIYSIAAICHELGGNHDTAKEHAHHIRQLDPGYSQQTFFRSFQFSDLQTRTTLQAALRHLSLG